MRRVEGIAGHGSADRDGPTLGFARNRYRHARNGSTSVLYLTVFASAFLAATFVPFASELALAAGIAAGGSLIWLVVAATLGNTLGAVVNWILGRFIELFRDRKWFPADASRLERAQAWFRRYGVWTLLLAWLPILGDALTVVAGLMRIHIVPFLILTGTGKALRYVALAVAMDAAVTP